MVEFPQKLYMNLEFRTKSTGIWSVYSRRILPSFRKNLQNLPSC